MAQQFTSETLPSGVTVEGNGAQFKISFGKMIIFLNKGDINRMHGIAFPEKRRSGICENKQPVPVANPHGDDDHGGDKGAFETEDYFSNQL